MEKVILLYEQYNDKGVLVWVEQVFEALAAKRLLEKYPLLYKTKDGSKLPKKAKIEVDPEPNF